ncbi:MAG: phosphoserine phosphatase SerB [bacterium]|nr:phosphoserine phosphatase SerB [bacterium]
MREEKDYVIVTVSGQDRPGITAAFTNIIVAHNVEIVDIDQATLHDFLALSFLLDLTGSSRTKDSVLKDMLFEANRLEMRLNFQMRSEKEIPHKKDKKLFVLTVFGGTPVLAAVADLLGEHRANIEKISNLSLQSAECIELTIDTRNVTSLSGLKERLMTKSAELDIDLAFQSIEAYRKSKRLVVFDMDRTLIDTEVIDEMARAAGAYDEVSRVTEKAMRGDLDFEDSLRQRVAFLKGLKMSDVETIRDGLALSEGARELVDTLRRLGYRIGVVSGGFDVFADHLKETLGLDFAFANTLEVKNGVLTGRLSGDVIEDASKAKLVNRMAREMSILLDQTVAIGDGANDRLMLGQAGLGIAYNAHQALKRSASVTLGHKRLMNILYILGITEEDMQATSR